MKDKTYLAIDLKSFYASVECMERGLDPMRTNLVVADESRTEKTICLAVSPSLKAYGIPGRPRLFEVVQKVKEINARRALRTPGGTLTGSSWSDRELREHPDWGVDYLVAPPRMATYIAYSTRIYQVYLRYIAPEDIHVYSIDEVFIDATPYLRTYGMTARELTSMLIREVWKETCITATAGIGSNLYLCKIAMDILAKHADPDENGIRMAELTEQTYKERLWDHRPLTDFWRVGRGYARKLEAQNLFTMGDIARCSLGRPDQYYNEALLYKLFGINAELLIDHAWGYEPCTLAEIKAYRPATNCLSSGQVLTAPYPIHKLRLVVREMTDLMSLDLVSKGLVTDQLVLTIGYDIENLQDPRRRAAYHGPVQKDAYGRSIPKHAHGTANLQGHSASSKEMIAAVLALFDRIMDPALLARRVTLTANHVIPEHAVPQFQAPVQLDFFSQAETDSAREEAREKEKRMQKTLLAIQEKYGKNAIVKGMNLEEGATTMERNEQIGGHRA